MSHEALLCWCRDCAPSIASKASLLSCFPPALFPAEFFWAACRGPLPSGLAGAKLLLLLNIRGSGMQQITRNRFGQRLPPFMYYDT